ncbi:MAG: sterol desaturase family protein [Candidatus Bathyarchaeota archaeon]|nr:MAG: sterol desaturase family protein [Candidatus Bathyarchaeota archaeon]
MILNDSLLALLSVIVTIIVILSMEGVAWFLHKYVMHGFGWFLHEDHHRYTGKRFQKNDVFGMFFALLSFAFILSGILSWSNIRLAIGIGVMSYGIGYFLVHDVFFHSRIRTNYRPKGTYLKRVLQAHAIHHQKSTAHTGVNFGFLYASKVPRE